MHLQWLHLALVSLAAARAVTDSPDVTVTSLDVTSPDSPVAIVARRVIADSGKLLTVFADFYY